MAISSSRKALAAGAMMLCVASAPSNVGTISVELMRTDTSESDERAPIDEGVSEALGMHGFTVLGDPGHSALIAEVSLRRTAVGTGSVTIPKRHVEVSPGLFGAAGGGVTIPFPARQARAVALVRFQLDLRIRRREAGDVVWRGTAITVRGLGGSNSVEAVASDLGQALLRSYPAEPREVVSVP